jgi:hypothetical protein
VGFCWSIPPTSPEKRFLALSVDRAIKEPLIDCARAATAGLTSSLASAPVLHKAVVGNLMPSTWIWTLVVNDEDPLLPTLDNVNMETIGETFDGLTYFPPLGYE